jgi:dihydrofolate reductase
MRKLIMWNIITLDGYFDEEKEWNLSFHNKVWGPDLEKLSLEQLRSADYLIFGRKTYEGMAAYWKTADNEKSEITRLMNSLPKLVFSKTLKDVDWNNTTLINGDASAEIAKRKTEGNGDMYVFGSADLSKTFMEDDLFDEYRIGIAPIILGRGKPLFKQGVSLNNLKLIATQKLNPDGVVLTLSKPS